MFFLKQLQHTISLHPQYFSKSYQQNVIRRLHAEVEGTCNGQVGFICAVLHVHDLGPGELHQSTGMAEFNVTYDALVFRPFKGQVIDAITGTVNKMGIWADVGPMTIFISEHLIPNHFKFDANTQSPAFVSEGLDNESGARLEKIEKGTVLRVKIIGTRLDATDLVAIGSIKEDFLGLQELP
ncbi:DNA-directed RNA polymerase II subunit [Rhizophlyctis rosea]|nr:DNA-directed RNA polymerase II subunit [Rhizophlyctis rosea]